MKSTKSAIDWAKSFLPSPKRKWLLLYPNTRSLTIIRFTCSIALSHISLTLKGASSFGKAVEPPLGSIHWNQLGLELKNSLARAKFSRMMLWFLLCKYFALRKAMRARISDGALGQRVV